VANSRSPVITIITDERQLRALVRNSLRSGVAMTRTEERRIEDEFIRRARNQKQLSAKSKPSEVSHDQ
jgi:hypothetical protein